MKQILLLAMILAAPAAAQPGLDPLFQTVIGPRDPGLAVLVRQNGRTLYQRAFGVGKLTVGSPITAETNFRLASFTKQFTAAAIMLLIRDGKLRYDTPLAAVFPDFPAYGRGITIRHLLTHTSGLPDYEELMPPGQWTPERQIQDEEVLALIKKQSRGKFVPGTSWSYSNSGYVVLGLVIANVSGKPFPTFLHDRIFGPLRMIHTLAYVNGLNTVSNRAYGHTRHGDRFIEADQSSTSATLGDGGVYSNLADLAKWDQAIQNHTLFTAAEMSPALTPVKLADGRATRWPAEPNDDNLAPGKPVLYGFGWFLDPYQGRSRMWHSGTTTGFRTVIERFPEQQLTIVILCNRDDLDPAKLALQAADVVSSRAR